MNDLPLLKQERSLFWLTFALGFVACAVDGINRTGEYGWTHPSSIGGSILGGAALFLGLNVLFRGRLSDRTSLFALLAIVVTKVVLARLYGLG
ncbi:MAG TPA: hypothetical protein VK879_19460 [Candidatus Sulfomarinibacteraceae bacterium]|nr:hypothetical protein [Candidatus Sulfomarinibacteraceae bacterium]